MTSVSLAFFNAWIIASTTCKSFSSNEFNMVSIRFLQLLLEFCVGYPLVLVRLLFYDGIAAVGKKRNSATSFHLTFVLLSLDCDCIIAYPFHPEHYMSSIRLINILRI